MRFEFNREKMTKIPYFEDPLAQNTHFEICGPKYPPDTPLPVEYQDDTPLPVEYQADTPVTEEYPTRHSITGGVSS